MTRLSNTAAVVLAVIIVLACCLLGGCNSEQAHESVVVSGTFDAEISATDKQPQNSAQKTVQEPELSIDTYEDIDGRTVFSLDTDDFTDSYNYTFKKLYGSSYLKPFDQWMQLEGYSPHRKYPSMLHRFSSNESIWTQPVMTFYKPEDTNDIYEIELTFDDHGFQQSQYDEFEQMSKAMLTTLIPTKSIDDINALYMTLYKQSDNNSWGIYDSETDTPRLDPDAVYCYENIGFYGYYGAGTINICIIPVTGDVRTALAQKGVNIISI